MNGRINIQKRGNMVLVAALFFMLVITEAAKGELPAQKAAEESARSGADMAAEYLPTAGMGLYYGADGRLYGTDLNEYFIGDPFTEDGVICGTGAIVTAADAYLEAAGSSLRAEDLTGTDPEELYRLVSEDQPVVVWVTISMADRGETEGWYTEDGEYVDWSHNDHGAVLIGYSGTTVTIADPISGQIEYDRQQFEEVFADRGNRCVVIG